MLSESDFKNLVRTGILPAIDLIIVNQQNEILIGKRLNKPAQNYWFVPGGRIYKNETINYAIKRIFKAETSSELAENNIQFVGVFEHFYEENYSGDTEFGTHYLMLCYKVTISQNLEKSLALHEQHSDLKWVKESELLDDPMVHINVKNYFKPLLQISTERKIGVEEASYIKHQNSYSDVAEKEELELYKHWFERNTTDLWRHKIMLSILTPFLKHQAGASWLTVGDGRFGTSAIFINKNGGLALATDIDTRLLEIAKNNAMISNYQYANAEHLPFDNDTFDYSYCKQSYHHFPRPILAVYEMLRVTKEAILFTEPVDFLPSPPLRSILKEIKRKFRTLIGKSNPHTDTGNYEPIGNYIYGINVREFEKIALGLNLPCIAYKRYNDEYIEGVEYEDITKSQKLLNKLKTRNLLNKIESALTLNHPNNIQMIVFKNMPKEEIRKQLKADGYTFIELPKNPFLTS